jgi:hypothetical protein
LPATVTVPAVGLVLVNIQPDAEASPSMGAHPGAHPSGPLEAGTLPVVFAGSPFGSAGFLALGVISRE